MPSSAVVSRLCPKAVRAGPAARLGSGSGTPQAKKNCTAGPSGGSTPILSGSATTNIPTIALGAVIGGAIGGEPGAFVGGLIGSFFGVGGTASHVPSTNSTYAGPTLIAAVGLGGGSGLSASEVNVPSTQNANSIAKGLSFSWAFQPREYFGSTVTKSPKSGPPVVGPSFGTRIPASVSVSYTFCLMNCGC